LQIIVRSRPAGIFLPVLIWDRSSKEERRKKKENEYEYENENEKEHEIGFG